MVSTDLRTEQAHLQAGNKPAAIEERIILPLPPQIAPELEFEMEIYACFMRHLRKVPNSRKAIKILCAIGFTAQALDIGEDLVAKTLCDLGLRAPRQAFPLSFLEFVDRTQQRKAWDQVSTPASVQALREHWHTIGEDCFGSALPQVTRDMNMFFYARH